MKTLKKLPIFNVQMTTKEKTEYLLIVLAGIFVSVIGIYTFTPAFATMESSDLADLIRTIVKIICFIVGALFAVVGVIKFAISHANEDGPAQQKAIMMMATGALLVILGATFPDMIEDDWFEVD